MKEIFTRRSTREYTGAFIGEEQMNAVIKAGMNAPSGRNRQPWQFVIIRNKEMIDQMLQMSPNWKPLGSAGQGILVCGDLSINDDPFYNFIDCSAAAQNLILMAEALDLGTCWLGVAPSLEQAEMLRQLLDLPSHFLPVNLISIGVKNEQKESNDRFLQDRIHKR